MRIAGDFVFIYPKSPEVTRAIDRIERAGEGSMTNVIDRAAKASQTP